jgi:hypothetical protein
MIANFVNRFEKYLKLKNEVLNSPANEVAEFKHVLESDPLYSLLVKRCPVSASIDEIKNLFLRFGAVVSIQENAGVGLLRSVFITFMSRETVTNILSHGNPIILRGEVLKIKALTFGIHVPFGGSAGPSDEFSRQVFFSYSI